MMSNEDHHLSERLVKENIATQSEFHSPGLGIELSDVIAKIQSSQLLKDHIQQRKSQV